MIHHKFFIGTTNPDKIREIGSLLSATGITFEVTDPVDPEETEPNFEGNAILKAKVYAGHCGGVTISEDSGIIIPALRGLPGPWSARFSEHANVDVQAGVVSGFKPSGHNRKEIDTANNEAVLALMRDVPPAHRAARFEVVLVVAAPGGEILFKAKGTSTGWISTEPRGHNGFGYDPIFVGENTYGKTYAELDSFRKNLRSHRKNVLREFQVWLATELSKGSGQ